MYRILVAEDSKAILRDIVHLIQEAGYEMEIETAYDGEMALEILRKFAPDIIVTDIKMPVINGLALIQRAKEAYPGVKCVIVSGYGDFIFTHEALMLQVDEYVMKPIDGEEFSKILDKLTKEADCYRVQMEEVALWRLIHDGGMAKGQTAGIRSKAVRQLYAGVDTDWAFSSVCGTFVEGNGKQDFGTGWIEAGVLDGEYKME